MAKKNALTWKNGFWKQDLCPINISFASERKASMSTWNVGFINVECNFIHVLMYSLIQKSTGIDLEARVLSNMLAMKNADEKWIIAVP